MQVMAPTAAEVALKLAALSIAASSREVESVAKALARLAAGRA